MAGMEQPESPPRPFPARSPEFHRDHFRGDRFSGMYNDDRYSMNNGASTGNADDPKSCFVASSIFSFFVALTMAFGLYSSETLRLGPNSSILINPSRLFVESIEVVGVSAAEGSMLFGFHENPTLDSMVTWQETHNISLPYNTHKEWAHYLNEGSRINISYSVTSWGSSSIGLVIAEGNTELTEWLKDPSYPDTTFSWNLIHGNGSIQKDILKSSAYYIGVGNLNPEVVTVFLNMSIKASLYDTTGPYYKCRPAEGMCTFPLFFMGGNAAVLTSPGRVPGMVSVNCKVKLSYGPRWITYVVGAGGMILLMLLYNYSKEDENTRHLCAICFEAPKDSFFVPCGHCVACFGCANRVLETSATCPICRRKIKKAKKIYTV